MTDERLNKSAGSNKKSRNDEDRPVYENRELTEQERVDMFRQQFYQSALPDLPEIPGFHTCWLTTTNPRDSIQARVRLGYEPIRAEDIPGWEYATNKTGDYVGMIGVNEMLAFKLPLNLYKIYMKEAHHDAPLREEQKLQDTADLMLEQASKSKSRISEVGDGTSDIVDERLAQFES